MSLLPKFRSAFQPIVLFASPVLVPWMFSQNVSSKKKVECLRTKTNSYCLLLQRGLPTFTTQGKASSGKPIECACVEKCSNKSSRISSTTESCNKVRKPLILFYFSFTGQFGSINTTSPRGGRVWR